MTCSCEGAVELLVRCVRDRRIAIITLALDLLKVQSAEQWWWRPLKLAALLSPWLFWLPVIVAKLYSDGAGGDVHS